LNSADINASAAVGFRYKKKWGAGPVTDAPQRKWLAPL
jgi:hypothetical protein